MRSASVQILIGVAVMIASGAQAASSQADTPAGLGGPAPNGVQFAATTTPFPPGFGGSVTVDSKSCNADGSGSATFTADGTQPFTGSDPWIRPEAVWEPAVRVDGR
jgi:hypothetical protein